MNNEQTIGGYEAGLFQTHRPDTWWLEPLLTGLGFLSFVIYTTWAMFQGDYYWWSAGSEGFGGYCHPFIHPYFLLRKAQLVLHLCYMPGLVHGRNGCLT